jgi:thioredoxin 1
LVFSASKAAQPYVSEVLKQHPEIRHIWIEDGKGQRLVRIYRVKLWPTLILLRNGVEVSRVVRPSNTEEVVALLSQ